jgi:glucose/arabinose dehydrogenase
MKRLVLLFLFTAAPAFAQLESQGLIVPPVFQSVYPDSETVRLPAEYQISVYYAGAPLRRPRFLALGPKNTIFVADMNKNHVFSLRDTNHDGVADLAYSETPDLDTAHSLAFYHGAMYVAEPTRVRKFLHNDTTDLYDVEQPFITGINDTGYYNHFTRTILIDTTSKSIYLSVGASCNACRAADSERASILRFNLDGSGRRIYASGLRNALGLAINPWNGELWCTNADRDNQGDDLPREIITPVKDGGFYGWPFAFDNKQWDDFQATNEYKYMLPITAADSGKVAGMQVAPIMIEPHSTPMAIMFYHDPRTYIVAPPPTAFVAIHGSSPAGRTVGLGYKVIKLELDSNKGGWQVSDFLTGFLTDSINYKYWGRPCGLVQDSSGDIFLSCDGGIPAIYRISLKDKNSVHTKASTGFDLSISPNPAQTELKVAINGERAATVSIVDALGRTLLTKALIATQTLDVSKLPNGDYVVCATIGDTRIVRSLAISR